MEVADRPEHSDDAYAALVAGEPVTAAPPTILAYLSALEDERFSESIVLTPAREFSVAYRIASMAVSLSCRPAELVDSRTAGAGHGLVAAAALAAIDAGAGAGAVAEVARQAASRTELVAAVRGPAWALPLSRGSDGGTSAPPAGGGPPTQRIVRLSEGMAFGVDDEDAVSDADAAADVIARIVAEWDADGGPDAERCSVFHAGNPELASELATALAELGSGLELAVPSLLSPALGALTGIGSVGVAWMRRT